MNNLSKLGLAISARMTSDTHQSGARQTRMRFLKPALEKLGEVFGEVMDSLLQSDCYYFQSPVPPLDYNSWHLRMLLFEWAFLGDPTDHHTIAARRAIDMCRPGIDWDKQRAIAA